MGHCERLLSPPIWCRGAPSPTFSASFNSVMAAWICCIALVSSVGSEQESVKLCVFRDFLEFAKLDRRRRRRCGNVETRVLWGFPSSVSGAGIRLGKEDRPARGASFPQRTSIFRGLARLCPFSTRSRSRSASPEKPRSVRVLTDSRSEPDLDLDFDFDFDFDFQF